MLFILPPEVASGRSFYGGAYFFAVNLSECMHLHLDMEVNNGLLIDCLGLSSEHKIKKHLFGFTHLGSHFCPNPKKG